MQRQLALRYVFRHICLPLVLCISCTTAVVAQDAKDFDFNGNCQIDPGKEAEAFLKHAKDNLYRTIDSDKDGQISDAERDSYERAARKSIAEWLCDYDVLRDGRSGLPLEEANSAFSPQFKKEPAEKKRAAWQENVLVRRSHEDVAILSEAKDFKKAEGSQFAYTRDYEDDNDIWQARGAVIYSQVVSTGFSPTRSMGGITAYSLLPSVSFDRVSNRNNRDKDVDSLVFRLGTEIEYSGGSSLLESQYWRANIAYASDFSFDSEVLALEAQWEPVVLGWGIGTSRAGLGDAIEYRWRGIVHAEVGRTLDTGDKTNLEEHETFFRLGPKLRLELWPRAIERLGIAVGWSYLEGVEGHPDSSELFESNLNYRLDESGHFMFTLSYRQGEVPLSQDDVKTLSAAISIKY